MPGSLYPAVRAVLGDFWGEAMLPFINVIFSSNWKVEKPFLSSRYPK